MKKFRGCHGEPKQPYMMDGKPLDRCPIKAIPIEIRGYISLYSQYKRGHLPYGEKGSLQQPAKLMQVFDILEGVEMEIRKEREDSMRNARGM